MKQFHSRKENIKSGVRFTEQETEEELLETPCCVFFSSSSSSLLRLRHSSMLSGGVCKETLFQDLAAGAAVEKKIRPVRSDGFFLSFVTSFQVEERWMHISPSERERGKKRR